MTIISFVIGRIYGKRFKCNYLQKKLFLKLFAAFPKSISNFENFEKKDEPHSLCISGIRNWEKVS